MQHNHCFANLFCANLCCAVTPCRWLKDAATEADFFLDLQRMPATKL
jgi:hypothetical protein